MKKDNVVAENKEESKGRKKDIGRRA